MKHYRARGGQLYRLCSGKNKQKKPLLIKGETEHKPRAREFPQNMVWCYKRYEILGRLNSIITYTVCDVSGVISCRCDSFLYMHMYSTVTTVREHH